MKVYGIIIFLFFFLLLDLQAQFISGRVTYTNGKPAAGAFVWIKEKGGAVGAITDMNGGYHFEIDSSCITVCVNFINCFQENLPINKRNVINFVLKEMPVEVRNIEVIALVDRSFEVISIDKRVDDFTSPLLKYVSNKIEYPIQAIKSGLQGRVLAKIKIDSVNLSCSVDIIKGIDKKVDDHVKETILSFPDWKSVILTDAMIEEAISPDIYGFSSWLRPEKEYILPVIFSIKEMNNK